MGDPTRSDVVMRDNPSCSVCGETANGRYFGAIVCLPCKSFFIRCTKDGKPTITCTDHMACNVMGANRMRCQYCRYKKCISVGMSRKEKPESVQSGDGQDLCRVCLDIANGIHFGVTTCEGCKKFFRRALKEYPMYECKFLGRCFINPRNRNSCRHCRYKKCLGVGMSREAIRMGRPKKLRLDDVRHTTTTGCPYVVPRAAAELYQGGYYVADKFNFPQPHCDNKEPLMGYNDMSYGLNESRCGYTDHTSDDDSGFSSGASDRGTPTTTNRPIRTLLVTPASIKQEHVTNHYGQAMTAASVSNAYAFGPCDQQPAYDHGLNAHAQGVTLETPPTIDIDEVNDILASIGQHLGTMAPSHDVTATTHYAGDGIVTVHDYETHGVGHGFVSNSDAVKTEGASGSQPFNNFGANWNGCNDVNQHRAKSCVSSNGFQNYYNFYPSDNY